MFCNTQECHLKIFYVMIFLSSFLLIIGCLGLAKAIKISFNASILIICTGGMILFLNLFYIYKMNWLVENNINKTNSFLVILMTKKLEYSCVFNYFEKQNCKLLSKDYSNNRKQLHYICKCGNKSSIRFDNFQKGNRCMNCRYQ